MSPLFVLFPSLLCATLRAEELGEYVAATAPEPDPSSLQGGGTRGLEEFRFRHYSSPARLADFPDNPVFDYQEVVQRLQISGGSSLLTLGIQGDAVALFSNEYILDGDREFERPLFGEGLYGPHPNWWFGVEKLWLQGQRGSLSWTVGDSYGAFGKGLALNVVKNTDIDVDTSLRGVHATLVLSDVEVRLVEAVTNPQQVRLENPNVAMQADLPHAVHGLRADYYGPVRLGAHGVIYQFARGVDPLGTPEVAWRSGLDAAVAGVSAEASGVGPFDLTAEADWVSYGAPEIPVDSGGALYASATMYPGRASLLLEGKYYKDTEYLNLLSGPQGYELAAGPSLEYERAITEDSSATLNSNDVGGARARLDLNLGSEATVLSPYVSVLALRDADLGGVHFNATPETVVHGVGGVTWIAGELHLLANAGYRMDVRDDAPAGNPGDSTIHADVSFTLPVTRGLVLEFAPNVLRYHWGDNEVQQRDYTDVSNTLAVKLGTSWIVLLYTDFSDNELINSTGNLTEDLYGATELQWQPTSALTMKVFYGAYRSGIRCAGGQCRTLPGFSGARASLTANF